MARPVTGEVITTVKSDGLTSYAVRITVNGEREFVTLGDETDGWTPARADLERRRIAEAVKAGVWQPPHRQRTPVATEDDSEKGPSCPTVREVADTLLRRRGLVLADTTIEQTRWRLSNHLLPFFADHPVSAIDDDSVFAYIEHKRDQRRQIIDAKEAGNPLVDDRGVALRPLSNRSINATLATLAGLLDEPECKPWVSANAARGKGKRLKVTSRKGNVLEADEVASLLQAAERLDHAIGPADSRAQRAQELRRQGATLKQISQQVGVGIPTVHYYLSTRTKREADPPLLRLGVMAILAYAGPRVSEAARALRRDVDLTRRKWWIPDSKTDTGIREVDLSPALVSILERVFLSIGQKAGAPAFPTRAGTHRDRNNIGGLLERVVDEADRARHDAGLPPLPDRVTPHTLRRTYISLLLEAGAPLPYVMDQVGHKDEETVLGIYARVLKRQNRDEIGLALDRLVARAAS
jgi:integrase